MKRLIICILTTALLVTGCSSSEGVSVRDYEKLQKQYEEMSSMYEVESSHSDYFRGLAAEYKADYEILKMGIDPDTLEPVTETPTEKASASTQPVTTTAITEEESIFEGVKQYSDSVYKVGIDIPEGKYILLATDYYSGYYKITSDANGKNIIKNEIFDNNAYIEIRNGEYFTIEDAYAFDYTDFVNMGYWYTLTENCQLIVGYDIAPGEYKAIANSSSSGYYCIYDDWRKKDIVANNIFKDTSYIEVKDGEILILEDCKLEK